MNLRPPEKKGWIFLIRELYVYSVLLYRQKDYRVKEKISKKNAFFVRGQNQKIGGTDMKTKTLKWAWAVFGLGLVAFFACKPSEEGYEGPLEFAVLQSGDYAG